MRRAPWVILVVVALAGCSGGGSHTSAARGPGPALPEDQTVYYPSQDRVLTRGDGSGDDLHWKPLGLTFPADLARVHHALVLSDTALTDKDGNSKGALLRAGSVVSVRAVGEWQRLGSDFSRLYQVQGADPGLRGWIDAGAAALVLAEEPGLQVGIIPRMITLRGGTAEYSLLVVADGTHVTILDTSYIPYPDGFHPSGVVSVSLQDVNADSRAEIILEAETIVSLRFLGSTPIRWKAWLRRGLIGAIVPIFRYNESFGSDAGYYYSATDRLFDSSGRGFRDMVRVDTDYTLVNGADEFHNRTVSFYPWNGSEFIHESLQDLPKQGTVRADGTVLRASPDRQSAAVVTLARGEQVYVSDRSDTRQSPDEPDSWWYQAMTRSGAEGWINGVSLDLAWIDPLKIGRAEFRAQN
ncbi:MAG TPA: SH3 domain-containing protein [Spirochaetia bacterium]|nr:SH3 domain-containing protein [Spirochaetia bacterium]